MNFWVTADKYIDYYTKLRNISVEEIGVGPVVVASWAPGIVKRLADGYGAQPSAHWPMQSRYPLYFSEKEGIRVSFIQLTVGASATVTQMEQLIACGAKVFVTLGWAGSLNPIAPINSMLVPTTCIREEGTSYHYLAKDEIVRSDPRLASILVQAARTEGIQVNSGPHWSTDAIYREGAEKIAAYRVYGVLGVDMETSAMFALGKVYNVAVGNLLVVSDSLWGTWDMSFHSEELRAASLRGVKVMQRAAEEIITHYENGIFDNSAE